MALPPRIRRLSTEDFAALEPPVRKGMEKLVEQLNPFLSDSTGALERRLTWDNMAAVVKTVDVTVPVSTATATGSAWDGDWQTPTLLLGWTNFDAAYTQAGYRRHTDGRVYLRGTIKSGSQNPAYPVFTLPVGYRPLKNQFRMTVQVDRPGILHIKSDGDVIATPAYVLDAANAGIAQNQNPTTYLSLDDVSFEVSEGTSGGTTASTSTTLDPVITVNCKGLPGRPAGVIVLRCEDLTDGISAAGIVPGIAWDIAQSRDTVGIVLRAVSGLTAGRKYRLTLLVTI